MCMHHGCKKMAESRAELEKSCGASCAGAYRKRSRENTLEEKRKMRTNRKKSVCRKGLPR